MDNFGERYMAFFTPPFTDKYSMFITSDDQGELLMSDQPNITNVTRSVNLCVYVCVCVCVCAVLATPLTVLATPPICITIMTTCSLMPFHALYNWLIPA